MQTSGSKVLAMQTFSYFRNISGIGSKRLHSTGGSGSSRENGTYKSKGQDDYTKTESQGKKCTCRNSQIFR